jgi:ADP-L-glycero-D-manno-heptose 6-epimerase
VIVVTGAAGFIGSNVVADLEVAGRRQIAVVDWFGTGEKWRNIAKRSIAAFVDPMTVFHFLKTHASEIESIIHMGAISATTEKDVDRLVALNIQYSVSLWDWCAEAQVPFIYASSAATYGGEEFKFEDNNDPVALAALRPLNGYGWSKKAVDDIFASRAAQGQPTPPQWVGLKFFNVFGPNEYHKDDMRSVAVKLFDRIQSGGHIELFKSYRPDVADGNQKRDFIYVKDCTRTILWFLEHPNVSGIFNLGTGTARSFLDIAQTLITKLDKSIDIEFIDMPEALRSRYQYFTEADMTKLKSVGMKFDFLALENAVEDYLQSYLLREDRYR